jgi:hypothetical protein
MAFKTVLNPYTGELQLVNVASGGSGITGPLTSTVGAIVSWDNASGTVVRDNPQTFIQPGGAIVSSGFITNRSVSTLVQVLAEETWIAPELELELTGCIEIELDGEIVIV